MTNNKFIKIILNSNNEFRLDNVTMSILGMSFQNVNVKIDTGCPYSTIPIQRLNMSASQVGPYKRNDANKLVSDIRHHMDNGYTIKQAIQKELKSSFKLSYGIESGGRKHRQINLLNTQDIMNASEISFKHKAINIDFDGIDIPEREIYINYDRTGNILIGMDILKDWNIHIGTIDIGETIFLACPRDQINDGYLRELENTFHIVSNINALIVRQ